MVIMPARSYAHGWLWEDRAVELSGKRVLVTGATGGLGHAISRALHSRGAELVLTGRRTDVLEPLAAETGAQSIAADLSDGDEALRVVEEAGDVDVLVANAGIPASGELPDYTRSELERALDLNLRAPMLMTHALLPRLLEKRSGHLVFMSSLSGKIAITGTAIYGATKFGLRGFAQGLRDDLHGTGVGVSAIFPGPIAGAGMWAETEIKLPWYTGKRTDQDVAAAVLKAIERNRAEIDVNPPGMAITPLIAGIAPRLAQTLNRRLGGREISAETARRQLEKR
jgi:short-subunit dehydrogenase